MADYVYENVFVHYTMKQWGQLPEEIDPATTARVPILLSRDDRYFQDPYQGMPLEGYTPLFQRMLDHPRITVELGVDAVNGWRWRTASSALDGEPLPAGHLHRRGGRALFLPFRPSALPHTGL